MEKESGSYYSIKDNIGIILNRSHGTISSHKHHISGSGRTANDGRIMQQPYCMSLSNRKRW